MVSITSNLQEYEAITRGLVKGNPSVPVQGSPEESKQVSPTSRVNILQAFPELPDQNNRKSYLLFQSISHSHWLMTGLTGFAGCQ